MKNLIMTLCVVGSALTLAACDTTGTGNVDTAAPYASERTAGNNGAPAERVFQEKQMK